MTNVWLCPDQLFDGERLRRNMALRVADGVVAEVLDSSDLPASAIQQKVDGLVTPGFVDLQVNGGGGVLFNQDPTRDCIQKIATAHRRFGTVGILPTVITDAPGVLTKAADAVIAAKDDQGIAGIHIEGPHISQSRRGTHAAEYVRRFDPSTLAIVQRLRDAGVRVMITVAPEAASVEQIAALSATGAVVSLGHTAATADETRAGFVAGARCVTHIGNAMPPMENRAAGAMGAAINSEAYAGIICDGIHVADEMVGLIIRARPVPDRMFLVSDAMPTVGGPDHFNLYGSEIYLSEGRLVNAEGSLAGAHVTQAEGVARLVQQVGIDLEQALRMAITTPARLMKANELSKVVARSTDDLIVLDAALKMTGTLAESGPVDAPQT